MAGINDFPGFLKDFVRGSTKNFIIAVSKAGVPVDITGAKFYVSINTVQDPDVTPIIELTIDPPTDPINGKTLGVLTDEQTFSLPVATYYYSVKYITPLGAGYVIDMGKVKALQAVSSRLS